MQKHVLFLHYIPTTNLRWDLITASASVLWEVSIVNLFPNFHHHLLLFFHFDNLFVWIINLKPSDLVTVLAINHNYQFYFTCSNFYNENRSKQNTRVTNRMFNVINYMFLDIFIKSIYLNTF